jgi:DNA-binding NarL/FixJ family response regulator
MRRRPFGTVLAGSSALVREGLTRILGAANFHIVASLPRIDDRALGSLNQQEPLLLIIDSEDVLGATAAQIACFKARHSGGRVAVLADHCRREQVASAFAAGANAYFVGVANWDAFIKSLELVMLGETVVPPTILPFLLDQAGRHEDEASGRGAGLSREELRETGHEGGPRLSAREKCILHHLVDGHSNKVIARKIDITEATVKVHVKTILRKIGVHNRTQAAIWAMNNGSLISSTNAWPSSEPAPAHLPQGPHEASIFAELPNVKSARFSGVGKQRE